jgi:hypothetical protein
MTALLLSCCVESTNKRHGFGWGVLNAKLVVVFISLKQRLWFSVME